MIAVFEADTGKRYYVMGRCERHARTPQLNANVGEIAECGACEAEVIFELLTMILWPALDGYADRLTHHAALVAKLAQARNRLNLLSPGAGDWLDADVEAAHDDST